MENKFSQWLISKGIKFTIEEETVFLENEYDLRPHESELRSLFPEIEFIWEVKPNHRCKDM